MNSDNLTFHNVAAFAERPAAMGGHQLLRVPLEVGQKMSDRGRWNSQQTPGCEIRFVTDAPHFRLFLSSIEGDAEVLVFRGENLVTTAHLDPGRQLCLHVNPPENTKPVEKTKLAQGSRFAPYLWRVMLAGYQTVFHELDTFGWDVRPPEKNEAPSLTWLAYGSSITAGSGSARADLCYAQLAARRLGVDVLNMGFGGACHCEPALADFFADSLDWDFTTLELGVNMRNSFEPEEFAERAAYLIDRLAAVKPEHPIVVITPFITGTDHETPFPKPIDRQRAYETWMRQKIANSANRLHLIEGHELLSELSALNADMVHPGAYGHALIAERLAQALRQSRLGVPV